MPGWLLVFVCFGFPLLLIFLTSTDRWPLLKKINPVIACYVVGIILANVGAVTEDGAASLDLVQTAAVALSIPLLLFSVDFSRSRSLTGRAGLSMALAALSIMVTVVIAHILFRSRIAESGKIAGMIVGVYTGGTPNLAAISRALSVSQNAYLTVHTADLVLSAIYLLFVMTAAKPLLDRFLPKFSPVGRDSNTTRSDAAPELEGMDLSVLLKRSSAWGMLRSLGLAVAVAGIGGGIFFIAPESSAMVLTILALTTLSLGASFIPAVRRQKMSYPLGQYLILVFCLSVGALADLKILIHAAPRLFLFVGFCLFGSFLLHIVLARIVRIDTDTLLITSTSAVCSPPFVPLTAAAIGNRDLIAPGITTGLLGHAVGNYLGVVAAQLLSGF